MSCAETWKACKRNIGIPVFSSREDDRLFFFLWVRGRESTEKLVSITTQRNKNNKNNISLALGVNEQKKES